MKLQLCLMVSAAVTVAAQRPFFAGSQPIGYPVMDKPNNEDDLGNRFGEVEGTTQKLPLEALGDKNLVDRLSKLPKDQQPFWLLNWQALEEHRRNPQTYPQRPSPFLEPSNTVNANPQSDQTTLNAQVNQNASNAVSVTTTKIAWNDGISRQPSGNDQLASKSGLATDTELDNAVSKTPLRVNSGNGRHVLSNVGGTHYHARIQGGGRRGHDPPQDPNSRLALDRFKLHL